VLSCHHSTLYISQNTCLNLIHIFFSLPILPYFLHKYTEAAPTTVKLYLNKTSFSFDDAESIEPTQVLELTEEDYKPDKVRMR